MNKFREKKDPREKPSISKLIFYNSFWYFHFVKYLQKLYIKQSTFKINR